MKVLVSVKYFLIFYILKLSKIARTMNLRLNNVLSEHKILEQQINPKVLSVASSYHYNGNSKNFYRLV